MENKSDLNTNILEDVLSALVNKLKNERQKEEPYKELFKAGSTHTGLLRHLEAKMALHVMDACDVYKDRHGVEINNNQLHVLLALPLLIKLAKKNAEKYEGTACCVDKAYYILSEQILALDE